MNNIKINKFTLYGLMAIAIFSLSFLAVNQTLAHGGSSDSANYDEIDKNDFIEFAEARYEFMKKSGMIDEDVTKEEFIIEQEEMFESRGSHEMMGGFAGCPMHSGLRGFSNSFLEEG